MDFSISTNKHQDVLDITNHIDDLVKKSGVKNGVCLVFVKHATAAIMINENADPNINIDFLNALNKAFPDHAGYLHDKIDNNAGAHIKAAILGPSESIPIENGSLVLGTWQSIMLVELDGPRSNRSVHVTIVPS